jgi:hypothetical protein
MWVVCFVILFCFVIIELLFHLSHLLLKSPDYSKKNLEYELVHTSFKISTNLHKKVRKYSNIQIISVESSRDNQVIGNPNEGSLFVTMNPVLRQNCQKNFFQLSTQSWTVCLITF